MANFCKNCGGQLSPGDQTCPACGEPVPGAKSGSAYGQYSYGDLNTQNYSQGSYTQGSYTPPTYDPATYTQYNQPSYSQPYSRPVEPTSVAGWIGWMLLCSILPIIGQIIMIISCHDETLKNYAKATLVLYAIGIVLSIICVVLFSSVLSSGIIPTQ